jgi:hypothetical protein
MAASSGGKIGLTRKPIKYRLPGDFDRLIRSLQTASWAGSTPAPLCGTQSVRAFLSYASEHRELAHRLALGLRNLGVETFLDRDTLPPGESFDDRIASAIGRSDVFIFLISPEAVARGAYTLTELGIAEKRWPHPSGSVLPVFIEPVAVEQLPPYLRAVTILDPSGEPVADTLHAVAELAERRRRRRRNRMLAGIAGTLLAIGAAWALYLNWPALLGNQARRALNPPVIENAQVAFDPSSGDTYPLRFDATLYNPSPDAITTVSVVPQSDDARVTFGSTTEAFFALNHGERRPLTVQASLQNPADDADFRWRLCWSYVKTEDWYAEGMHEQSGGSLEFANFLDRHSTQVCDDWRPWPQGA